tara:strand:+ start:285 stop:434 length:150 start_codon:yes stop_codon:yes gene_type:complete
LEQDKKAPEFLRRRQLVETHLEQEGNSADQNETALLAKHAMQVLEIVVG